jgi:hypothetical protein
LFLFSFASPFFLWVFSGIFLGVFWVIGILSNDDQWNQSSEVKHDTDWQFVYLHGNNNSETKIHIYKDKWLPKKTRQSA